MPEFGSLTERDLAEKLVNIPKEEMEEYHRQRVKKYRWFYITAVIFGVFSIVSLFLGDTWKIIGIILAVLGILIVAYGSYQRKQWIRIYENLLFVKKKREKAIMEQEKGKKIQSGKYNKLKK